jgi:tripartite ATP-independent transporter DctP family solute receptor
LKASRKRVLTAGAAAGIWASIGFIRYRGDAAQFSFKLGNVLQPGSPPIAHAIAAADKIKQGSNGQLEITVFPNSALGSDTEMIAQNRSGALEMILIGNNVLANVVPSAALLGIPFAYASTQQMLAAANGELGSYIGTQALKADMRFVSGAWFGGTFQMENSLRPIETPADLKGMKMRVPPGPLDVAVMRAFGAAPASITISEVYTSLQTHLVDGISVPLLTVESFKYYELLKYVSMTEHNNLVYLLFVNKDVFARLPKNLQDLVDKTFSAESVTETADFIQRQTTIEAGLKTRGLLFNKPALAPFRQIIRSSGLYAQWRDQFDPAAWAIMEKTTGNLA